MDAGRGKQIHILPGWAPAMLGRVIGMDEPRVPRSQLSAWLLLVCGTLFASLVITSSRYGYHRDEMYFIIAGAHPAFGYPDQPPLVPLLCQVMQHLAPGSLTALRLPSALTAALTTLVAALTAREIGGAQRAQLIAAGSASVASIVAATGHFVTTTTFDVLTTSLFCFLVIRALMRGSGRSLLLAGITVGIGFEFKPQIALVGAVALVALAILGPRWPFTSWWLVAGVFAAAALSAPYVAWQTAHGWPQLTVAHNVAGSAEGGRLGFIPFQLLLVSPALVPVWLVGLVAAWRGKSSAQLRFLSATYVLLLVLYIAGNGKAYYLASLYPTLLGLGAVPVAAWTRRHRPGTAKPLTVRLPLVLVAIGVSGAASALLALPLLPATALQGSAVMAVNPDQGETVGWPDFVATVSRVWHRLPENARDRAVIFTSNYGEAGAIDLLGRREGLPEAFSGHNAFSEWALPGANRTTAVVIGYDSPAQAGPYFTRCTVAARVSNRAGLDNNENGLPVLVCQAPANWAAAWPHLTHLD